VLFEGKDPAQSSNFGNAFLWMHRFASKCYYWETSRPNINNNS